MFCPFCGTKFIHENTFNGLIYPEIQLTSYECKNSKCNKKFHIGMQKK